MGAGIRLEIGGITLTGELYETDAAKRLEPLLPVQVTMTRWGEEYYGTLLPPLGDCEGDTTEVLEVGELAYWEPGDALCLFFGPTPASEGQECRAASNVNVFGKVIGDLSALWDVADGAEVIVKLDD